MSTKYREVHLKLEEVPILKALVEEYVLDNVIHGSNSSYERFWDENFNIFGII